MPTKQQQRGDRYERKQRNKVAVLAYLLTHPASTYEEIALALGKPARDRANIKRSLLQPLIDEGYLEITRKGTRALVLTRAGRKAAKEYERQDVTEESR